MEDYQSINKRLARRLLDKHPLEAARLLEGMEIQDEVDILLGGEVETVAEVLRMHERWRAASCLAAWPKEGQSELWTALDPDLTARLLRLMHTVEREAVLSSCPKGTTGPVRRLLKYPEGTAGATMDPEPYVAPEDVTVSAALKLLERGASKERCRLFVVTRDGVLVGVVDVAELLLTPREETVGAVMMPISDRLPARADRIAILSHPGWQRHHTLPVVDQKDVLIGAFTYPMLRELETDSGVTREDQPLSLAVGEMYWTVMTTLLDGVFRALLPRTAKPYEEVRR